LRAVVFEAVGQVRVVEVPDPVLQASGDAVIRVTRTAICGSDLHFFHGKAPIEPGEGIGHEAVGVVEETGDGVRSVSPGDRVVAAFNPACGECWFCRSGQPQLCEEASIFGAGPFGGSLPGAQAERLRVPKADFNLLRVPDEVDDDRAVFLADVLTTGWHSASVAGLGPNDTVAIVGCGPIGISCIQSARALGAGLIVALDMRADRLELARSAGAVALSVRERHAETAIAEMTDGRGADVVLEAVGSVDGFRTAVEIARRGGRVVMPGMYTSETAEVQLGLYWARALSLRFIGPCPVQAWWGEALEQIRTGHIDPLPIVSHRLPLEEAPTGYEIFDRREATKVLLRP
jgi:threonine dehydrogenase-like Zn-dependent dehydrogenase